MFQDSPCHLLARYLRIINKQNNKQRSIISGD